MTSAIFQRAARDWNIMRNAYELHVGAEYVRALREAGAFLVNKQGRAQGLDGYDLFTGPQWRAEKYASEELLEYWVKHPRLSLADFERRWMEGNTAW